MVCFWISDPNGVVIVWRGLGDACRRVTEIGEFLANVYISVSIGMREIWRRLDPTKSRSLVSITALGRFAQCCREPNFQTLTVTGMIIAPTNEPKKARTSPTGANQ